MGVDFCGFDGFMAQEFLNIRERGSAFHEMGGETVAKGVARGFFIDRGFVKGLLEDVLNGARRDGGAMGLAGE